MSDDMKTGINKYIGVWETNDGYQLHISKTSDTSALVSLYNAMHQPIKRPYFNENTTIQMVAGYDDYLDEFRVDLWERGKGFELNLTCVSEYLINNRREEVLVTALSRYEEDDFLDKYYGTFGSLQHFVRVNCF
jgi:hypothetical protein